MNYFVQVNFNDNSAAFSYQASFPIKSKGRTSIIFSVNEEVGALAKALAIFEVCAKFGLGIDYSLGLTYNLGID